MKNDLRTKLNTALQDVDWKGEDQVLQMIRQQHKPVRRVLPSRSLIFAIILLMMMATTAIALTLRFSGFFDAKLQAKRTVQREYALTDEMIDLFTYEAVNGDDRVVATFTMKMVHSDRMGVYSVSRTADGKLDASWSHDNADAELLASGSLASPAWGVKQLERILPMYRQQAFNWNDVLDYSALSLEERAVMDAPMLEVQEVGSLINIAPGKADLSIDTAEQIARKAIVDKYGVAGDALPAIPTNISFYLYGGTSRREYRFDLDSYVVYVASPSGKVTYCRWMVLAEDHTLPDGDLSNYPVAAEEYMVSGAFDLLTPEKKASVAQRFNDAGLAGLLPRNDFISPSANDMREASARRLAEATLEATYNLPDGWESLFTVRTSLVNQSNRHEWIIEYLPNEQKNWHWCEFDRLGIYTVTIDAGSGNVISHAWSFDHVELREYSEHDFANAPAYSGDILPWVLALLNDLQEILDKYPEHTNLSEMSLEDRGAYDVRMRAAGYPAQQYNSLIPQSSDIPQEEAAVIALDALNTVYDLSNMSLVRGQPSQESLIMVQLKDGSWIRAWIIVYTNNVDIFTVQVNSETGMVENIWHDSPAFSNG